jgi:TP901 family phage tail tape measure protein
MASAGTVESRLIITAQDKTGVVIDALAAKIEALDKKIAAHERAMLSASKAGGTGFADIARKAEHAATSVERTGRAVSHLATQRQGLERLAAAFGTVGHAALAAHEKVDALRRASGLPVMGRLALPVAGAAAVGIGGKMLHDRVAIPHHDYQQAYLYQQAVLGLSKDQQQLLLDQAIKIGSDTKFTNADIIKAQTDIGGKLPKDLQDPKTIAAITEHTKNYALAMKVSMEEASVAMVGWMKSRGYDLSSPEAAERSARRTANQMVEFAKTTGAKHHDLVGDTKFGAAPGRVGGFSEEFANALSSQLIRLGYEGAMAGTFVRAAALKLSAPTQKGMAAIASMGLSFDNYVKPGASVGSDGLNKMMQQRFGRSLTAEQTGKLQEIFDDPEKMGDRGAFVEAASEVLNSTFARKDKKGKINAQDAMRISKTLGEFHLLSSQGVDSERLMRDIISGNMSPAVAKYLFGTEHGGRALSLNAKQLEKDEQNFRNTPNDRASGVAQKMQEGAQGEYTKMVGSMETFTVALGEATDGLRSFSYKGIAAFFDSLTWFLNGKPNNPVPLDRNERGELFSTRNPLTDPALMEQARRRSDFVRQYPEAARGEAFGRLVPTNAQTGAEIGQAVSQALTGAATITVNVQAGDDLRVLANQLKDGLRAINLKTSTGPGGLNQGQSKAGAE